MGGGISKLSGTVWKTYNQSNGLPSNFYNCAYGDITNRLWFGSAGNGVVMFNGSSWQTFDISDGLASNIVHHIMQDNHGKIWVSGPVGISILTDSIWYTITTADGLPDNFVYSVTQDINGLYHIATRSGVCVYDSSLVNIVNSTNGLAENSTVCVFLDATGEIWYGHEHQGLSCFDGSNWFYFNQNAGFHSNNIQDMVMDQNNRMWFATNNGLTSFDGTHWKTYLVEDGHLPSNNVFCLAFDQTENKLWIGTSNGLVSYNGTQWNVYTTADGLKYNYISDLFFDSQQRLWVSYYVHSPGLSVLSQGSWTHYSTQEGLFNGTISMTEDTTGNMWFAGGDGISKLSDHFTYYTVADGLPSSDVKSITTDASGNIYAGCYDNYSGGITKFDGNNWSTTSYPLIHTKQVYAVYGDSYGNIWVGGNSSNDSKVLSCYTGSTFKYYYVGQGFGQNTSIRCLYEDNYHNLWASGYSGVSRLNLQSLGLENENDQVPAVNLYPNPCNGILTVETDMIRTGEITLLIFDIAGRLVIQNTFCSQNLSKRCIQQDCSLLDNGTYFCTITAGNLKSTTKLVILK